MDCQKKHYAPVGLFEKKTSLCPLYLAWIVIDEVRNYFWTELPEGLDDELAERAEMVFARNARWRKKFQGARGCDYLEMFMRHWLSSALFKRRSSLFRELPDSFKMGRPLPITSLARQAPQSPGKTTRRKPMTRHREQRGSARR